MFQQLIASPPSKVPRKPLTLLISVALHAFFILLLISVPLLHPETLASLQTLIGPPPPLSAPRRAIVKLISSTGKPRTVSVRPNPLFTPDFIPPKIDLPPFGTSETNSDSGDFPQVG